MPGPEKPGADLFAHVKPEQPAAVRGELVPAAHALPDRRPGGLSPDTAQALSATMFGTALLAWITAGTVGASMFASALLLCIAVPFIGWFIGLPIVLFCAFIAACIWVCGAALLAIGWGATAILIAVRR